MTTPGQIKELFPIGDRIEYQTERGSFSGVIAGYELCEYGISLDLGDRRFPLWREESIKMAESFHKSALSEPEVYGQLTMFREFD